MLSLLSWTLGFLFFSPLQSSGNSPQAQDPLQELRQRVERLESKKSDDGLRSGYDDGFFWETADGSKRFVIEGLMQMDGRFFQPGKERTSEFVFRRMRPEFTGTFERQFQFHLEPNFQEDGVEMEEAWVGWVPDEERLRVMLGRMKEPFGLEEMRSRRGYDFVNFSILNQFFPAEDQGITVMGNEFDGVLEYGAALYNGTGGSDTNSSKDLAGRIFIKPFALSGAEELQGLGFGLAGTFGRQNEDVSGGELESESKAPFLEFAPGVSLDGKRSRLGAEFAWNWGPALLQSEAIWVRQEMNNGTSVENIDFHGYYVSASCFITGDEKRFGRAKIQNPVTVRDGKLQGSGGWQLAARYSSLHCDSELQSMGFTVPGMFSGDTRSITAGVNWVLNVHTMLRFDWNRTLYGDSVVIQGDGRKSEDGFMAQLQVQF